MSDAIVVLDFLREQVELSPQSFNSLGQVMDHVLFDSPNSYGWDESGNIVNLSNKTAWKAQDEADPIKNGNFPESLKEILVSKAKQRIIENRQAIKKAFSEDFPNPLEEGMKNVSGNCLYALVPKNVSKEWSDAIKHYIGDAEIVVE